MSAGSSGADVYEALDGVIYILARVLAESDIDKLTERVEKLERLTRLLDMLDEEKISALERLLTVLLDVGEKYSGCVAEAVEKPAQPVSGLRGALSLLKDEDVARGLGKIVEILRALGRCERA